jgi:hypothetical protein
LQPFAPVARLAIFSFFLFLSLILILFRAFIINLFNAYNIISVIHSVWDITYGPQTDYFINLLKSDYILILDKWMFWVKKAMNLGIPVIWFDLWIIYQWIVNVSCHFLRTSNVSSNFHKWYYINHSWFQTMKVRHNNNILYDNIVLTVFEMNFEIHVFFISCGINRFSLCKLLVPMVKKIIYEPLL